jgi:ATP phosphoribosyltransferase
MTVRVALPSRGRLRDGVLGLLADAGYPTAPFHGAGSRATVAGAEFIEMRPRDAGAWLATGRITGAFISTDIVMEEGLEQLAAMPLGMARSDLIVASRDNDGRDGLADLAGATVATHLPRATARWFGRAGVDVTVVTMGGSLEGVCAAGLADAIVDLRETGSSLAGNHLRVLDVIGGCEALFVHHPDGSGAGLADLTLRLGAVLKARDQRYVMLHLPPGQIADLATIFSGLAAPTVLPLAGRDDLVAVHLVVPAQEFWTQLAKLQELGASGIVALPPDALLL